MESWKSLLYKCTWRVQECCVCAKLIGPVYTCTYYACASIFGLGCRMAVCVANEGCDCRHVVCSHECERAVVWGSVKQYHILAMVMIDAETQ